MIFRATVIACLLLAATAFPRPYNLKRLDGARHRSKTVSFHLKHSKYLKGFRRVVAASNYVPDDFGSKSTSAAQIAKYADEPRKIMGDITIFAPSNQAVKRFIKANEVADSATLDLLVGRHVLPFALSPSELEGYVGDSLTLSNARAQNSIPSKFPKDMVISVNQYGNAFIEKPGSDMQVRIKRVIEAKNGWIYLLDDVLPFDERIFASIDATTVMQALYGPNPFPNGINATLEGVATRYNSENINRNGSIFRPNFKKFTNRLSRAVLGGDFNPELLDQEVDNQYFLVFIPTNDAFVEAANEGFIQRFKNRFLNKDQLIVQEHICVVNKLYLRASLYEIADQSGSFTCTNMNDNTIEVKIGMRLDKDDDGLRVNGAIAYPSAVMDSTLKNGAIIPVSKVILPDEVERTTTTMVYEDTTATPVNATTGTL